MLAVCFAVAVGTVAPTVSFKDTDGKVRTLPDNRRATLVIYEDEKAGKQNVAATAFIDATTNIAENKDRLEAVPIADLARWSWWPARYYALKEVRKVVEKEKSMVYIDWTADVRKRWQLARGKSSLTLLDQKGQVLFFAEGTLTPQQLSDLRAKFELLGLKTPAADAQRLESRHEEVDPEKVKRETPEPPK